MRQLFLHNSSAIDAWQWYNQNRNQFHGSVYIVGIAIQLNQQESIQYLESIIAARDLQMFIFESSDDERRFHAQCKSQRWNINSTIVSDVVSNFFLRIIKYISFLIF